MNPSILLLMCWGVLLFGPIFPGSSKTVNNLMVLPEVTRYFDLVHENLNTYHVFLHLFCQLFVAPMSHNPHYVTITAP